MDAQSSGRSFTLRCATIFVTEGDETVVYRSDEAIPDEVRTKLEQTSSAGTATIFIANRGGRDELAKRLRGLPSRIQTRLEEKTPALESSMDDVQVPSFYSVQSSGRLSMAMKSGIILSCGLGLLAWLILA